MSFVAEDTSKIPALDPIKYVQRGQEDETILHSVYRALTPPESTGTFHSPTDFIHVSWDEYMSVASDEWTPISGMIGSAALAADTIINWPELRRVKTPGLSFIAEGADPSPSDAVVPLRYSNVMATQAESFKITDEAQIVARAGGLIGVGPDEFARQMGERMLQLARDQELAIIESHYHDSSEPRMFRGLLGNYRNADGTGASNNGWLGDAGIEDSTTFDFGTVMGGTELTKDNLNLAIDKYMLQLRLLQGGKLPNYVFIPPRLMSLFKDRASDKIRITMTQAEVGKAVAYNMGGQIGQIITAWGTLNVVAHPLLEMRSGAGDPRLAYSRLLFLDPSSIRLIYYKNYAGVHVETRAKTDATETRVIKQIYTLQVRNLLSHGFWHNVWSA